MTPHATFQSFQPGALAAAINQLELTSIFHPLLSPQPSFSSFLPPFSHDWNCTELLLEAFGKGHTIIVEGLCCSFRSLQ